MFVDEPLQQAGDVLLAGRGLVEFGADPGKSVVDAGELLVNAGELLVNASEAFVHLLPQRI